MSLEKNLFRKVRNSLSAAALSFFLCACPNPTSPNQPNNPTPPSAPQISPNTVVLSTNDSAKINSVNDYSLTLSQQIPSLSLGKIIVSDITPQTPCGLLRKVSYLSPDGKTIFTSPVSLEEVVDNYSFSYSAQLSSANSVKTIITKKGISRDLTLAHFEYNFTDVTLVDLDGNKFTKDDDILASGDISFSSKLDCSFHIKDFRMENFNFQNTTMDRINLSASSPREFLNVDEHIVIAEESFAPFVAAYIPTIPQIPIILTPKIEVALDIKGKSSSLITAEIDQNALLTLGFEYRGGKWNKINSLTNNFTFTPPEIPETIEASFIPNQKLSLWLYDSVSGIYAKANEYLTFDSQRNDNKINYQIHGGIIGDGGIDMGIFSNIIPNYSTRLLEYDKLLASGSVNNPLPVIKTLNVPASQDAYVMKNIVNGHTSYSGYNSSYLEIVNNNIGVLEDALLQFSLSQIPANSHIASAKLKLYGSGYTNTVANPTIGLVKIKKSWNESNVKWDDSLFDSAEISEDVVGNEGWYEWNVASLVQQWINGYTNYGLALYTSNNISGATFRSSENADTSKCPILEISYY